MRIKTKFTANQKIALAAIFVSIITSTLVNYLLNIQNDKLNKQNQRELFETQSSFEKQINETENAFIEKTNRDQEQFQKELVATQNEYDRQNSYTNLSISWTKLHTWDFTGGFVVKNDGLAIANNVVVIIMLEGVREEWKDEVQDIGEFELEINNYLNPIISTDHVQQFGRVFDITGNNRYLINFGNIPPGTEIYIQMYIPGIPAVYERRTSNTRKLIFHSKKLLYEGMVSEYYLRHDFESLYKMADFSASANCDNCINSSSSFLNDIIISNLGRLELDILQPSKMVSNGEYEMIYKAEMDIITPHDRKIKIDDSDIIINVVYNDFGNLDFEIVESSKP